jgi:hypothetical protein
MQSQFGTKVFRATADCTAGRITTTVDLTYTLDGLWDKSDVGAGRTRWRDADGNIVARDLVNNGLHISQQWETLCPAEVTPALIARAAQARGGPAVPNAAAPPVRVDECAGRTRCYDAGSFVAEIVQITPSIAKLSYDWHVVTMSIRFRNKTNAPIVLGYVAKSGALSDNFSNSYRPSNPDDVKGMGTVEANKADPQFVLQPGESRAASFIQARQLPRGGNQPMGMTYTYVMSIAELQVLYNGQQIRTLRENSLTFADFALTGGPSPAAVPSSSSSAATPSATAPANTPATTPVADVCAGRPNCADAGPFVAEIITATPSITKLSYDWHVVTMNIRFRNKSDQPIVLAYPAKTAALSDNFSNTYRPSNPEDVKGIGTVGGGKADPQFILRPGESRQASFIQARQLPRGGNQPMGQAYTFILPISELEVLYNGQQIRTVREHSLTFPGFTVGGGLATGSAGGAETAESIKKTGEAIRGLFGKGKK